MPGRVIDPAFTMRRKAEFGKKQSERKRRKKTAVAEKTETQN